MCVLKSVKGRTIQPGGGQRGPGLQQLSLFLKALNYESEQRKPLIESNEFRPQHLFSGYRTLGYSQLFLNIKSKAK